MRRMLELDAVLKGMAVAIVIGLPVLIVGNVVENNDSDSRLVLPLFVALLLGFALAGFVASRSARSYAYTNGAVAALLGFLVIACVSTISRAVGSESIEYGKLVATALLAYGCGLTGGVAGARRTTT